MKIMIGSTQSFRELRLFFQLVEHLAKAAGTECHTVKRADQWIMKLPNVIEGKEVEVIFASQGIFRKELPH